MGREIGNTHTWKYIEHKRRNLRFCTKLPPLGAFFFLSVTVAPATAHYKAFLSQWQKEHGGFVLESLTP